MRTDIGLTGGGASKHMVYSAGRQDHTTDTAAMVEHLVKLVEARAALLQAEADAKKAAEEQAKLAAE